MNAPLGVGTFLVLAGCLLMAALPAPRSEYWIGEIEGVSMAPLLNGQRKTFVCAGCGRGLSFDFEKTQRDALLPCMFCGEWQVLPESAKTLSSDRVLIGPADVSQLQRGEVLVISHPQLGRVIKRLSGVAGDTVRITPHETQVNGRAVNSTLDNQVLHLLIEESQNTRIESPFDNLTVSLPPRSMVLKPGEFFVIGDDLENSTDSRDEAFGLVRASQIVGKVVTILPRPSSEPASQTASISKAK